MAFLKVSGKVQNDMATRPSGWPRCHIYMTFGNRCIPVIVKIFLVGISIYGNRCIPVIVKIFLVGKVSRGNVFSTITSEHVYCQVCYIPRNNTNFVFLCHYSLQSVNLFKALIRDMWITLE